MKLGFPCGSAGKESACNVGNLGSIPGLERSPGEGNGYQSRVGKIPWRREWLPTPVELPGEFHGQRNLAGYCPWGYKESDTTEQLSLSYIQQLYLEPYVLNNHSNPTLQIRNKL